MKSQVFKFLFILLGITLSSNFGLFAKSSIEPCQKDGAKVIDYGKKIKKVEISLPFADTIKNTRRFSTENITNDICFELLAYNEKSKTWTTIEVFKIWDKYEIDLTKNKLKTIAIAPNKNCENFELQYKKDGNILKIQIVTNCLVGASFETILLENPGHSVKVIDDTCYFRDNYRDIDAKTKHKISVFFDSIFVSSFDSPDGLFKINVDVYEDKKSLVYSLNDKSGDKIYLFYNSLLLSTCKSLNMLGLLDENVYYTADNFIYKNEKKLYLFDPEFPVYLINKNLYYATKDDLFHKSIWKNDTIFQNFSCVLGLKSFAIGKNEEIAYTVLKKDGSIVLYKGGSQYAIAKGDAILIRPTYSPDGKKFYFIEGKPRGGYYYAYYLHGDFPVPSTLGFTIINEFKFSPNSKYVATSVEDLHAKQWFILTGKMLGPFDATSRDYYFSDDSKIFFYRYYDKKTKEWIDAEEKLN